MILTLHGCIILGIIVFLIGMFGIAWSFNSIISSIISIEISFLGANIIFAGYATFIDYQYGTVCFISTLVVAAAEVAIALALISIRYHQTDTIMISSLKNLID